MLLSWKSMFKPDMVDHLARKVLVAPSPSSAASEEAADDDVLAGFDVVRAEWISCFISDSGGLLHPATPLSLYSIDPAYS
jgi:hypothetical protein